MPAKKELPRDLGQDLDGRIAGLARRRGLNRSIEAEKSELLVTRPIARAPTHPGELIGEILEDHFNLTIADAAERMGITRQALHNVVTGRSSVSADMAARFGRLVDADPALYLAMQGRRDLWLAQQRLAPELDKIKVVR
jgi:addiction module HigA family antidote